MTAVTIERRVCVKGGGCSDRAPWIIQNIEEVNGCEFICLKYQDTGFCRFVSGQYTIKDTSFLERLKMLRTQASFRSVGQEQESALFQDAAASAGPNRKQKQQARAAQERGTMPPIVQITLPAFTGAGGNEVPGITIQALSNLDSAALLKIEVKAEVLAYVREALLAHAEGEEEPNEEEEQDEPAEKVACKEVRWRGDKSVWLSTRVSGGKKTTKSFRVKKDGSSDRQYQRAVRWAHFEESEEEQQGEEGQQ